MGSIVQAAQRLPQAAEAEGADSAQYLTFRLGAEIYAIGIANIKEIIEFGSVTPVPMMPEFIRGVINVRGAVVPVIDLAVRFGHPATPIGRRTCVVIVEIVGDAAGDGGTLPLGILVDGVNEVLEVEAAQIEDRPEFGLGLRTDFVRGMIRRRGQFTVILDTDRVLSASELERLVAADAAPPAEAAAA